MGKDEQIGAGSVCAFRGGEGGGGGGGGGAAGYCNFWNGRKEYGPVPIINLLFSIDARLMKTQHPFSFVLLCSPGTGMTPNANLVQKWYPLANKRTPVCLITYTDTQARDARARAHTHTHTHTHTVHENIFHSVIVEVWGDWLVYVTKQPPECTYTSFASASV